MRIHHMGHCSTQTDEVVLKDVSVQSTLSKSDKNIQTTSDVEFRAGDFVKYPCYYCGLTIESKGSLKEHIETCNTSIKQFNLNLPSKPSNFESFKKFNARRPPNLQEIPPVGFPPFGFPHVGFPATNPRFHSPFHSPWSKKSL